MGGIHGARSGGADDKRGVGVDIGHVDEVPGRAGGIGDAAGGDDGRVLVGKRDRGVFVQRFLL